MREIGRREGAFHFYEFPPSNNEREEAKNDASAEGKKKKEKKKSFLLRFLLLFLFLVRDNWRGTPCVCVCEGRKRKMRAWGREEKSGEVEPIYIREIHSPISREKIQEACADFKTIFYQNLWQHSKPG